MYLIILIIFKLNSSFLIENGPSFGAYYPRLNIKLSFEGSPGEKLINKAWSKNLYFGAGVFLILKEEKSYKGFYFSSYYKFLKAMPYEHFFKIDYGFFNAFKKTYLAATYNISYFINNEMDFRLSFGPSIGYNTNLDLLLGINFKI